MVALSTWMILASSSLGLQAPQPSTPAGQAKTDLVTPAKLQQGRTPRGPVAASGGVQASTGAPQIDNQGGSPSGFKDLVNGPTITGRSVAWHPITFSFRGPMADELDVSPNPFLDYRMTLVMTGPSGQVFRVPGFFNGDGEGSGTGDVWSARVITNEGGTWLYRAEFHSGTDIAVDLDPNNGTPTAFHGINGAEQIDGLDASADGFYKWGLLTYTGDPYLKFVDGPYFLKGGTNGPENLLGYGGFDNTFNQPGGADDSGLLAGLHFYVPHISDFVPGDPHFVSADTGIPSVGIIGALNYLSSVSVNSVCVMPINPGGGRDTYPFVGPSASPFDKTHYDVSKLHQWNQVFEHAMRKTVALHVILSETELEAELYFDGGTLGVERMLFYREMIARFGHLLAVKWDISEDTDFSTVLLDSFADYLAAIDPFDHPIAFQSKNMNATGNEPKYTASLGNPRYSAASIRGDANTVGANVERWAQDSLNAGHRWVVDHDVQTPVGNGLTPTNADDLRKRVLYDVYFSGGNIEWNLGLHPVSQGGGQIRTEDLRTREDMWLDMRRARIYLSNFPIWLMSPGDNLLTGESPAFGGGEVFHLPGLIYSVYLPSAVSTGALDLSATGGDFNMTWFNPRTGMFEGPTRVVTAGGPVQLGLPPGITEYTYLEQNGIVVVEYETQPPVPDWVAETQFAGFAGDSYYRWAGPNQFNNGGVGVLRFNVIISDGGTYKFKMHNMHNHPLDDQENDFWLNINGTGWNKVFSNEGPSIIGVWNWSTRFEFSAQDVDVSLSPGFHTFEVSGRSTNMRIDRVHLYKIGTPNPLDLTRPESALQGPNDDWVASFVR